jgi:hypothetical protein
MRLSIRIYWLGKGGRTGANCLCGVRGLMVSGSVPLLRELAMREGCGLLADGQIYQSQITTRGSAATVACLLKVLPVAGSPHRRS